jgi:hypothetical protein
MDQPDPPCPTVWILWDTEVIHAVFDTREAAEIAAPSCANRTSSRGDDAELRISQATVVWEPYFMPASRTSTAWDQLTLIDGQWVSGISPAGTQHE